MTKSYKEWLDLDVDQIEPIELSAQRKMNLKQTVLKKQATRKRMPKWVRHIAAAAIIGVSMVTSVSIAFPTLASQIPFMKNIASYFDNKSTMLENFDSYATEIGQVHSSNGLSMMIENAVYDGTSMTISFALETDKDLGDSPFIEGDFIDIKGAVGGGGSTRLEKISDNKYVGLANITPHFDKEAPDELEVIWKPEAFLNVNNDTKVEGDWAFNFKVSKLAGELQLVNETVSNYDVTARFTALEKNDMSTVIRFEYETIPEVLKKWPEVTVQFDELRDNLGNTYVVNGNGAASRDGGISYKSSATVQAINPTATSITFVPVIYFSLGSGKGTELKEMDPVTIPLN
ncbi:MULTISPECIES: DUF4179 domain-containing protein [unclassified Lysinibacillus]|uniref:DUF4179 domain-containing protein n=1 Tax=unclassified Lysinibacillus TaxID=2636778 RepID=UPI0020137A96|nr:MULTISPECIES: DUF4179 domain-containing protein [unclassified Lysinibacillus]MCL1698419.1 DUF4179 domain-containing protein [Lysinibacillus sp. BPa_S21]MCL1703089.1 DUF4179 domain-containing protein [Lysinibacillus sp. Bpr_S20]